MFKLNKGIFSSSAAVFILYSLFSLGAIIGFYFFFPGQLREPLPVFERSWRFIQGLLQYINLFPALAMSALMIPMGFRLFPPSNMPGFSPEFLAEIKSPVITAIAATVVYGLLFFLAQPLAQQSEANMRYQAELYHLAEEKAAENAGEGQWREAAQFLSICERIWPGDPGLEALRVKVSIEVEDLRLSGQPPREDAAHDGASGSQAPAYTGIPGQPAPVDAVEAMAMAEKALSGTPPQPFDAHWLATLAERLSRPGSVESAAARRLASQAWNAISSMEPNSRQTQTYIIYRQKISGYEAMVAGDWIRAYYIFKELSGQTSDPDTVKFLDLSEKGLLEIAFFTSELEKNIGEALLGAVFSIPWRPGGSSADSGIRSSGLSPDYSSGRLVCRISSLSTAPDYSYCIGLECIAFDGLGQLLYRLEVPYAKIAPLNLGGAARTIVLMRALDREDSSKHWEPVWTIPPGVQAPAAVLGNVQLVLDLNYDDFLLLAKVQRGIDNLLIWDLYRAEKNLRPMGHIPQVFQAEILHRIFEPVIFLPLAILAIVIGWRYRAVRKPRYLGVPMLFILPLVFNGLVHFCWSIIDTLGISLILSVGFSLAAGVFIAGSLVFFILALIILAAQHG